MTFKMPAPVHVGYDMNYMGYTADQLKAAYLQGLEDASLRAAIHSQYPIENDFDRGYSQSAKDAAERIRAHEKEQG